MTTEGENQPIEATSDLSDRLGPVQEDRVLMVLESHFTALVRDAKRWKWLRAQRGWPESESAASEQPPEWLDRLADEGIISDETMAIDA